MAHPAAQVSHKSGTEMAQKRGRKTDADRSAELANSLPRGITIGEWHDGRAKPFFVRHGSRDSRKLESFASEQERNDTADKLAGATTEHGTEILGFDAAELREYREFRARCAAPLAELEALWARDQAAKTLTVETAATRYMALWTGKEPAFRHVRLHMKRLTGHFGAMSLASLSTDLLRDFNERLRNPEDGKPMSDVTKRDHLKNWNSFFVRCVLERWIQFNPCDLITLPTVDEKDRDILTPRQIFDLLKANRDRPVVGKLAFELFGGLRSSSAARLMPEHVKRESKGIRLPGAKHKSGKAKFRQKHPDALWAWYDHSQPALWEVTAGVYDERKHDAFTRANVDNPGNVLRNSFITYMLAFTNDPPLVSRLAQHSSLKMLEIYEGVATEQDAALVMRMTPEAVGMEWAEFVDLVNH